MVILEDDIKRQFLIAATFLLVSCIYASSAIIHVSHKGITREELTKIVTVVLEKQGFKQIYPTPEEIPSPRRLQLSYFQAPAEPALTVTFNKPSDEPFKIVFSKVESSFGNTANLYRTVVHELEVTFGTSSVQADQTTSRGEHIL